MEDKSWLPSTIKYLQEQAETAQMLKELLEWCIDNRKHGRQIPRDEDRVKVLEDKLRDVRKAQEDVNHHLNTMVAELQSAVSPHGDDESAGPSDHNDHGGDDKNIPASTVDDDTAAGDHTGGKAPERVTSTPSSGSSSSSRNEA